MDFNTLNAKVLTAGVDQLLERYVVSGSAVTSKTFSNLLGDTDLVYYIKARIVNGYNGSCEYFLRANNDSANNYRYQIYRGADTSTAAAGGTSNATFAVYLRCASLNQITVGEYTIYAKSGTVRTCVSSGVGKISGTTVDEVIGGGNVWNNTADQITSLSMVAQQTNGLGIGSEISLYARRNCA